MKPRNLGRVARTLATVALKLALVAAIAVVSLFVYVILTYSGGLGG
ncbi:MAG TPA: hypothetical protein VHJ34_07055 [Actinomycetota bacterium]|nr:hypothetical protein [Actinomycetota bacterium]